MEKMCSKCKFIKPCTEFYVRTRQVGYPNSSAGYSHQCKQCLKEKQIAWRKNNPDKAKNVDLKQTFGIDLETYNYLFGLQKGHCAICNVHQSELQKALAIDHDHRTGVFRGLLCQNCNHGLGNFKDNPEFLKEAINYLRPITKPEVAEHNTTVVVLSTKKGG